MDTTIINRTALNASCRAGFNQVAYDGCDYIAIVNCPKPKDSCMDGIDIIQNYINSSCDTTCAAPNISDMSCEPRGKIYKYNSCFELCRGYDTMRKYDCLCYDCADGCYYAVRADSLRNIYKLNCDFSEIDCIHINTHRAVGKLTGISYDCCDDRIIAACTCGIFAVNKCTGEAEELYRPVCDWIMGVTKCCGLYFTTVLRCHKYAIVIYDEQFNELGKLSFDDCELPVNVIDCGEGYVDCLVRKRGKYYYVYRVKLPEWVRCCPCPACRRHCHDCHDEVCTDVVESVAKVECAISHILNAEGEKLQKIIACADDLDSILCANDKVNDTIISITQLEQVLYNKLAVVKKLKGRAECREE